jgi:transposase
MMANREPAGHIADVGRYEFGRQLSDKAERRGGQILVADRWLSSSKICSECATINNQLTGSRGDVRLRHASASKPKRRKEFESFGREFHAVSWW